MNRFTWLALVFFLGGWELFRSPHPDVERGNQAFRDGRYDDALKAYDKAAEALPNEPGVRFNRGVASYQKAQGLPKGPERDQLLGEAQREFEGAAASKDGKLRSAAEYNLGNTHFQKEAWDQAIKSYADAIKDDPQNLDARHNLELAVRRKKSPPPQQQQGDGKQQQPKDGQGQQQQQQQPKDGQGQQPQDQDQQPKPGDGTPQPNDGQPQPQPPSNDQPPPKPGDEQKPDDQKADPKPGDDEQKPKDDGKPDDQAQDPGQDPSDAKDGKPGQDRPTYGDAESKMDALERRSKDLKVKSQGGGKNQRRRAGRDW
jgi:Ca-activated chloride channel family protein